MKRTTVLLVLALLMSASAFAETIYLHCTYLHDFTKNLTVDLDAKTVNNDPATVGTTAIDWQTPASGDGLTATVYSHIDRVAGTYSERVTYHLRNGDKTSNTTTYDCTPASAPKTKF